MSVAHGEPFWSKKRGGMNSIRDVSVGLPEILELLEADACGRLPEKSKTAFQVAFSRMPTTSSLYSRYGNSALAFCHMVERLPEIC